MKTTEPSVEVRLREVGLIPILRKMPKQQLLALADAVIAGGAQAIEITLDSPDALGSIARLRERYGDTVLVGAGTVMRSDEFHEAARAGAQFFLSPHLHVPLAREAIDLGYSFMPGVLTPSEIVQAEGAGVRLMKLFPAGSLGPGYLKDLLGPFHGRSFFPTGGITPDNAADFLRAGAAGLGMGSALLARDAIERQAWDTITEKVRVVVQVVRDARGNDREGAHHDNTRVGEYDLRSPAS